MFKLALALLIVITTIILIAVHVTNGQRRATEVVLERKFAPRNSMQIV